MNIFHSFDQSALIYFYTLRTPLLVQIMSIISLFGREIIILLAILIALFLFLKKHTKEAGVFIFILSTGSLISTLIKESVRRPRPPAYLHAQMSDLDASFPSGHSMGVTVFFCTLLFFIFHYSKNKILKILSMCFSIGIVLLVGLSRIYLGLHYPSDVFAGYFFGISWFLCCWPLLKKVVK